MNSVGIIGVGAMGLAMALRLRDGGLAVAVRDIDPGREALALAAGCTVAATPAALAAGCDVLIVAVVDGAQLHEVLFGIDGAAPALRRGAAVLLCPTVAPADAEAAAVRLAERGVDALDAPMSGGPQRARDGTMSLMVAGADAAIARCEPLLNRLASRVFRVGARPGDAARTKLVNNLLAAANLAAAAEALALAHRLGLDAATTADVIGSSSGQSWIGGDRARRWLAGDATLAARCALLAKDSALALAAARAAGTDIEALPLGGAAAAAFAAALRQGHADADDSALFSLALQRLQP